MQSSLLPTFLLLFLLFVSVISFTMLFFFFKNFRIIVMPMSAIFNSDHYSEKEEVEMQY